MGSVEETILLMRLFWQHVMKSLDVKPGLVQNTTFLLGHDPAKIDP
jgi:hypothetical protein